MKKKLSHVDARGKLKMVDVTAKDVVFRQAVAGGRVRMNPETLKLVLAGGLAKGDLFATARLAGIQAAKRTAEIIPLCHPLEITHVEVELRAEPPEALEIVARVRTRGRTGVEMEALTAVAAAALTVYDMAKAVDKGMVIEAIYLIEKKKSRKLKKGF
jgi:cyclic pyranopterin phosphate synthase